jgi:hypothetical protein
MHIPRCDDFLCAMTLARGTRLIKLCEPLSIEASWLLEKLRHKRILIHTVQARFFIPFPNPRKQSSKSTDDKLSCNPRYPRCSPPLNLIRKICKNHHHHHQTPPPPPHNRQLPSLLQCQQDPLNISLAQNFLVWGKNTPSLAPAIPMHTCNSPTSALDGMENVFRFAIGLERAIALASES